MIRELTLENCSVPQNPEKLTILDFYATWCGPCGMMSKIFQEVANERDVDILKTDVEELDELSMEYKVRNLPTYIFITPSGKKKTCTGTMTKEKILEVIDSMKE